MEIEIKVKFNSEITITLNPDKKDWDGATKEERDMYIRDKVCECFVERDDLCEELVDEATLTYNKAEDDE